MCGIELIVDMFVCGLPETKNLHNIVEQFSHFPSFKVFHFA